MENTRWSRCGIVWLVWDTPPKPIEQIMKMLIAYGLISFAIGTGLAAVVGRLFDIPWLIGQFTESDPGMAVSTALAFIALGVGVFMLHSVWRNGKPKAMDHKEQV